MNVQGLDDPTPPADYEIWPEHAEALGIFLACDDQWLMGGNGVMGLNMAVLIRVMEEDLYNVKDKATVLRDVRTIASRARGLMNQAVRGG
jgi:hypothetical protein